MKLLHKKKIIAEVEIAKNSFARMRGLMFRSLKKGRGLVLVVEKESILHSSIHMLFVFYPIDVLWVDNTLKVVDKKNLKPFQLWIQPKKAAKYVVELRAETTNNISVGDMLTFLDA